MTRSYMGSFLAKYVAGVAGLIFAFGNFVACGTQLYQISLDDDLDHARVHQANPDYNNPKSTMYGIHAPNGWQQLPIPIKFGYDMSEDQKVHFLAAVKKWEWAVGKKLFVYAGMHEGVTGDSFDDLYSSLNDSVNGQYLDNNWGKTEKPDYVLATAIWSNGAIPGVIRTADIRFNHQNYKIGDSLTLRAQNNREVVDMLSLALHELGHLLGLAHVEKEVDPYSIMTPSLFIGEGLTSREITRGDIERIQQIYGCEGKACDIDYLIEEASRRPMDVKLIEQARIWLDTGSPHSPDETYYTAH